MMRLIGMSSSWHQLAVDQTSAVEQLALKFTCRKSDELAPFHKQVAAKAFLVEPIVLQPDSEGHYISVMTQVEQDLSPILFPP